MIQGAILLLLLGAVVILHRRVKALEDAKAVINTSPTVARDAAHDAVSKHERDFHKR